MIPPHIKLTWNVATLSSIRGLEDLLSSHCPGCESIIVVNVRSSVDIVSRCPEYYCNVYTQLLSSSLQSIIASLLQVSGRVGHCLLSQLLSLTRPKLRSTQHTLQVRVVLQRTERIIETFIGFKPPGHTLRNSPWTPSGISNHNSSLILTFLSSERR